MFGLDERHVRFRHVGVIDREVAKRAGPGNRGQQFDFAARKHQPFAVDALRVRIIVQSRFDPAYGGFSRFAGFMRAFEPADHVRRAAHGGNFARRRFIGLIGKVSRVAAGEVGDASGFVAVNRDADAIGASDGGVHFKADKFHGSAPRSIFKIGFLEF